MTEPDYQKRVPLPPAATPPARARDPRMLPPEGRPPVPPQGRAMPELTAGPAAPGRRVQYLGKHVIDVAIRRRIRRGYYDCYPIKDLIDDQPVSTPSDFGPDEGVPDSA